LKERILPLLVCPQCTGDLECLDAEYQAGEIKTGKLRCLSCHATYPITNYIPRFVPDDGYASSFGFQWNKHARTQLDNVTGTTITHDRFFNETRWPHHLEGCRMLEAGCGAGRFTQVAVQTGVELFSFDYSRAVDANLQNNGLQPNLHLLQADIYHIPFKPSTFDYVFCLGVIQHTPDPPSAFRCLVDQVRPGGNLAVDVYAKRLDTYLKPKYALRGITKRVRSEKLYRVLTRVVPPLMRVKAGLKRLPVIGGVVHKIVPICYYGGIFPLNERQQVEWSILDTFDMLSAHYDKPQSLGDFRSWFAQAPLGQIEVAAGSNGYVGVATRRPGSNR
jgi:SAM-dependent methyltransferase